MAFHLYPQVIPAVCNPHGFGPPRACSARFTLPMGRSPGFGSIQRNSSPFQTRFRSGSSCPCLNLATPNYSLAHSTKGTPSPISLRSRLRPAGSARFQVLFHSPRRGAFHLSLTVLVPYRSLTVFSLGLWSTLLPTRFRVSGSTYVSIPPVHLHCRLRDSHPLRCSVPVTFGYHKSPSDQSATRSRSTVLPPRSNASRLSRHAGLGSSPFARRYWGNPLSSSGY